MLFTEFAERHRLIMRRDSCGDPVIVGKAKRRPEDESHIFEGLDGGRLGLALMLDTPRRWNSTKRRLADAGMTLLQDGDYEGTLSFDPENPAQVKLAFKEARIRHRKNLSPEDQARRANNMRRVLAKRQAAD